MKTLLLFVTSSLILLSCFKNPFDPENISSRFDVPFSVSKVSDSLNAYSFFPIVFNAYPVHPEFIHKMVLSISDNPLDSPITLLPPNFSCSFIYPDTGNHKARLRVYVSNSKSDVFDTSFTIRSSQDIHADSFIISSGSTVTLKAYGHKPDSVYWNWDLSRLNKGIFKSLLDTHSVKITSSLSDTIFLYLSDSKNSSSYKFSVPFISYSTFQIIDSSIGPGYVTPKGLNSLKNGDSLTVYFYPNKDCKLTSLVVDNKPQQLSSFYSFKDISSSHSLIASFGPVSYQSISFSKIGMANILPSSQVSLPYGSDTSFHIIPFKNYKIDSISLNGKNIGSDSIVSFKDVDSDHSAIVYLSQKDTVVPKISNLFPTDSLKIYSPLVGFELSKRISSGEIRWMSTAYGTLDPNSPHVTKIDSLHLLKGTQVILDTSVHLVNGAIYSLSVNFEDSAGLSSIPAKSVYIRYIDTVSTFVIKDSSIGSGYIIPSGSSSLNKGDSLTVNFFPNKNCKLISLLVDNKPQQLASHYTFNDISSSHSLLAEFGPVSYQSISFSKIGKANILPSSQVNLPYGSDTSFNIIPFNNYRIDSISVDGKNIGSDSIVFFKNIISDHSAIVYCSQKDTIVPKISNLFPTDSMKVYSSLVGFDFNKKVSSGEIHWMSTAYGTFDSKSPHVTKIDSLNLLEGTQVVLDTSIHLVSGAIYSLSVSCADSIGLDANPVKSFYIQYIDTTSENSSSVRR